MPTKPKEKVALETGNLVTIKGKTSPVMVVTNRWKDNSGNMHATSKGSTSVFWLDDKQTSRALTLPSECFTLVRK